MKAKAKAKAKEREHDVHDDLEYTAMLEENLKSMRAKYDDLFLQYNGFRDLVANCAKRLLEFDVQFSLKQRGTTTTTTEGGDKTD